MRRSIYILGLATAALAVSCGKDDGKDDAAAGSGSGTASSTATTVPQTIQAPGTLAVFQDDEVAAAAIANLLDEGAAGAAEDNDDGGTGQALTDMGNTADFQRFRACAEDGDHAVVTVKRSGTLVNTVEGPLRISQLTLKAYDESTRDWSKAGGVKCDAGKKHAALKAADMSGVTLKAAVKRRRSTEVSLQNKKKGTTVSRSVKLGVDGLRTVVWSAATAAGATVTLEKTVTSAVKRTADFKNKADVATSLAVDVVTKDGAPLAIAVERDAATGAALTRTIKSGTLVATSADGTRLETTFAGVKYGKDGGCLATTGKITGSVFAKDGTSAAASWTIDFDAGGDIVTSDGKTLDYTPDGCDLDVAGQNEADKASATDISDPVK